MRASPLLATALLGLFLLRLLPGAQAQAPVGLFVGLGYNQSYASLDSLNFILGRFNESRPEVIRSLGPMHLQGGLTARAGYAGARWTGELAFTGRRAVSRAQVAANSTTTYARAVRLSTATVDIGIARRLGQYFQVGASLDLGAVQASTQETYQDPGLFWSFPYDIVRGLTLGNTVHVQAQIPLHKFLHLDIRPYYQRNWVRNDFALLHQTINPQTFQPDPDVILVNSSNVGLKIMLTAYIN